MQLEAMRDAVQRSLDDAKAVDVVTLDVRALTDVADFMVIASGTSKRHVSSIADRVTDTLRVLGVRPLGVEGRTEGEWVLVDFGYIVVHVMYPQTREFYGLEKLWSEELVRPVLAARAPRG